MKRRTFLKGALAALGTAVARKALPAPAVRGALAGEVAPPAPPKRRVRLEEWRHEAFWTTLEVATSAVAYARARFQR